MTAPFEFFRRYATQRRTATELRVQRMRAVVPARLRGFKAPGIANSLEMSTPTLRDMLREVGMIITDARWQHVGYSCFDYRLEALGVIEDDIVRTGAHLSGDMWVSADTPRQPSRRWRAERAQAHRRHLRRQRHRA